MAKILEKFSRILANLQNLPEFCWSFAKFWQFWIFRDFVWFSQNAAIFTFSIFQCYFAQVKFVSSNKFEVQVQQNPYLQPRIPKVTGACSAQVPDIDLYTPLHKATDKGHVETCTVLLDAGADLNASAALDYSCAPRLAWAPRLLGCGGESSRMRQTLEGSFSAVSTPKFASKYAFESSRRDPHNALLCTINCSIITISFKKVAKVLFKKCER